MDKDARERESFEAWWSALPYSGDEDEAWRAWQARSALSPPAGEAQPPVWIQADHLEHAKRGAFLCRVEATYREGMGFVPLYAAPPSSDTGAQGLTDEQIDAMSYDHLWANVHGEVCGVEDFARAILAASPAPAQGGDIRGDFRKWCVANRVSDNDFHLKIWEAAAMSREQSQGGA